MLTFNRFEFNTMGAVETKLLVGKEKIEALKKRVMIIGLEEVLPIDFGTHTLTIFQGCRQDQGVKENMESLKEHLFLGALCAPTATLRIDDQMMSKGEHDENIVRTFSLKFIESC